MSTSTDFEYFTADGEYELETALGLTGPPAASSPALLMEHLGALAANAESEAEAEAFLGALVPLATKLAPAIARATPQLVRGVAKVGRQLWRNPSTRRLVAAVPRVVKQTTADLARQHARGAPLTTQAATRSLAKQVANVLDDPVKRRRAVQRCRALDRRWHATRKNAGGVPVPGSRRCTCR